MFALRLRDVRIFSNSCVRSLNYNPINVKCNKSHYIYVSIHIFTLPTAGKGFDANVLIVFKYLIAHT